MDLITNNVSLSNFKTLISNAKRNPYFANVLINRIMTPERVTAFKNRLPNPDGIVYLPIISPNILPLKFAEFLARTIGGTVLSALNQIPDETKRRSLTVWQRIATRRQFTLTTTDKDYLKKTPQGAYLVDDQFTTGGTVRDAIRALETAGIIITGVITLGSCWTKQITATGDLINRIINKFGTTGTNYIESVTGYKLQELTQGELYGIIAVKDLESLQHKINTGQECLTH